MGCSHSSSAGGSKGPSKDMNYGGVYVGLPTDATTTYKDPKGAEAPSQSKARSTTPGSPLPENVC